MTPADQLRAAKALTPCSGAAWPGALPTLDMVMWEIRKLGERLTCFSGIQKIDADLLRELAEHKQTPARKPFPTVSERQKSTFVQMAEAQLLFGSYCDKEAERLAVKADQMQRGELDVAADDEWRRRNDVIGRQALDRAITLASTGGQDRG